MVLSYLDDDQSLNIDPSNWTATWLIGSGAFLDPGEQVHIVVALSGLSRLVGKNKEFSIYVKPHKGAALIMTRTTPPEPKPSINLQ